MELIFWGTRGSVAVPGPDTLRYGGNTTCAQLILDDGEMAIVDAGTGIRGLGAELMKRKLPPEICLLITHLHWDHINAIPFFEPLYRPDCLIRVGGWPKALAGLARIFDSGMSDGHFPVAFSDIPGTIETCPSLKAPHFSIGQTNINTCPLNHPQGAVAFCFSFQDKKLVFMTDNELIPEEEPPPRLVAFCQGADALIHDAQYLPEEMEAYRGRGHSDWRTVLKLAAAAKVKRLVLTHHDPNRTDDDVDKLIAKCRYEAGSQLPVEAAHEGMVISV